jgi:hypothetical protein
MNGVLSTKTSSGKKQKVELRGNPGLPVVQIKRRRADKKIDPTIISESLWQVVKARPGTWLTAVAKYGLKWPDEHLHRVYFDEWVQKCEPGADDTKADYTFWKTFEPGGRWEDGISKPPKDAKFRDKAVEVDSYWCFKTKEVVEYQEPDMDEYDEVIKRRKKMFDMLFEEAMTLKQKKMLLDKLNELENTAKNWGEKILNEEKKLEEYQKSLEDLRNELKNNAADAKGEVAEAIERWYIQNLEKSLKIKEDMEGRIIKEIDYLKFRCAEYDMIHEQDQEIVKIQKGTPEEDQWKKTSTFI